MINLQMLQLFVRVAETGTMTAAAREFDLAPSIASRKIAALERGFKTKLFTRTTRRLALTEAGKTLLDWAKTTTRGYEEIADELGEIQHRPSGLIRIVSNDYAAVAVLPDILQRFCKKYPEIRIHVSTATDPANYADGEFDIAFHTGRMPTVNLVGRRLNHYTRRLCAAPSYLTAYGTPQSVAELADHRCLVHTASERQNWSFEHQGKITTQNIEPYIEIDNYFALAELTCAGMGIARLSDVLSEKPLKTGALIEVLPEHKCVYPDGGLPASWLIFPDKRVLFRTRLLADFISEVRGQARARRRRAER